MFVVDADSHWSEPADLFTSRAPAEFRDRVPQVQEVDGQLVWVFDGHVVGRFSAAGVIGRDGHKESAHKALMEWSHDQVHVGAYDPKVRLGVLDECGIDAQIIFPSTIGLGGQDLGLVDDEALCRMAVEIYNDGMAEIQADSGNRLLPLPVHAGVERRRLRGRGEAGGGARGPRRQHDVRPAGPRCARPRQPRLGPVVGGVHRARAAGPLPHRRQRHGHDVLRQVPVGLAPREHQARHRGHAAVHRQRPGRDQPDPLGHVRPSPRPQDGVGRERRGLGAVHPRDARLRDGRERAATSSRS